MISQGYFVKLSRIFGRHEAEDLCAELALLAWKLQRKGWEDWKIKHGLRYKAMDYRRSMFKRTGVPLGELPPALPEFREPFRESWEFALELVAKMVKSEDQAVIMRMAMGETVREAARSLGISKSRAGRVTSSLKTSIASTMGY